MTDTPPPASRLQRLRQLVRELGVLGLVVHYTIYALVLLGFVFSMQRSSQGQLGSSVTSGAGTFGIWAAAYMATKLTLPVRLLGTLALTPLLRALIRRMRKSTGHLPVVAETQRPHEQG